MLGAARISFSGLDSFRWVVSSDRTGSRTYDHAHEPCPGATEILEPKGHTRNAYRNRLLRNSRESKHYYTWEKRYYPLPSGSLCVSESRPIS